MSFTRRMKYGNIMATRKLKKNVSSEKIELLGFLFVTVVSLFVINIAIMGM